MGLRIWQEHVGHADVKIDGALTSAEGQSCFVGVCVERGCLPARGRDGRARSQHDNEALASNIGAAIESKMKDANGQVALVLDSNDASGAPTTARWQISYVTRWRGTATTVAGSQCGL